MSYLSIGNVEITGISACVPKEFEEVISFPLFTLDNAENFIKTTGVERRRKAPVEVCSSDLCFKAAGELIDELQQDRTEIDCLVFVTQTPDYTLPATSVILQHRLGLSTNCYTLDISLGCSGWVDALSVISSLLSDGSMKKGLLLAGDTILKFNPLSSDHLYMNGSEIFNFTIDAVPPLIEDTLVKNQLSRDDVDGYVFHQANKFNLNFLRKKIKIEPDKFYTYMSEVGNTVSNTIPIVLTEKLKENALKGNFILAGFGVGYSWGGSLLKF